MWEYVGYISSRVSGENLSIVRYDAYLLDARRRDVEGKVPYILIPQRVG